MNTNAKILIVDDDRKCLKQALQELQKVGFQNIKTADTPDAARKTFQSFQPEIIMMDIRLEEYYPLADCDGIELLSELKATGVSLSINFLAVYLTALDTEEFFEKAETICPAFPLYKPLINKDIIGLMLRYAEVSETWVTKIVRIPKGNREYAQIDISKISYLKVEDDYVDIYSTQGVKLCKTDCSKSLTEWEIYLNENLSYPMFLRVRENTVVNMNYVEGDKFQINTLSGCPRLPIKVTEKYREAYRQALNLGRKRI